MMQTYLNSFAGGLLIGAASILMLCLNGKILGISGILGGTLQKSDDKKQWRYFFLSGLVIGGAALSAFGREVFTFSLTRSSYALVAAGLIVGFGTRLGSGCTSGHGICGISRFSPRSIAATLTFIVSGAATVLVINRLFGGSL